MMTLKPHRTLTYSCLATIRRHLSGRLETEHFFLFSYKIERDNIYLIFPLVSKLIIILCKLFPFSLTCCLTHHNFLCVMQGLARGSNWTRTALLRECGQSLCVHVQASSSTTPLLALKKEKPQIQIFGTYLDFIKKSSKEKFLN